MANVIIISFLGYTLSPDSAIPFTMYPDLLPELINYAHDDKRPASSRVGPQGKFGGGTNELKQDLGQLNIQIYVILI